MNDPDTFLHWLKYVFVTCVLCLDLCLPHKFVIDDLQLLFKLKEIRYSLILLENWYSIDDTNRCNL